jgi:hypothetical protein
MYLAMENNADTLPPELPVILLRWPCRRPLAASRCSTTMVVFTPGHRIHEFESRPRRILDCLDGANLTAAHSQWDKLDKTLERQEMPIVPRRWLEQPRILRSCPIFSVPVVARALTMPLVTRHPRVVRP